MSAAAAHNPLTSVFFGDEAKLDGTLNNSVSAIRIVMRGYKVTDSTRRRTFGIGCNSLRELREKGAQRLGIREEVYLALDDGTIIDDEEYFGLIPPQTIIIFYKKNESVVTGADYILKLLRTINAGYLNAGEKASSFVTENLIKLIQEEEKPKKRTNTIDEDPEWFANLETNATTKEEYMFRKSQERIKGYLYKFQGDVRKNPVYIEDSKARNTLNECLRYFREKLQGDNYFGCFFDRRYHKKEADAPPGNDRKKRKGDVTPTYDNVSYCDETGRFCCQGKWNEKECEFQFRHVINPYLDRESRILFSTWNLDHKIEKSRTVLPALVEAVKSRRIGKSVNYDYFYQLLFTNFNLKLVHVVCHDKTTHNIDCDMNFVFKNTH